MTGRTRIDDARQPVGRTCVESRWQMLRRTRMKSWAGAAVLALAMGCSKPSADEHLKKAEAFLTESRLPEAILELRAGTQPGEEIVRRGQGIPHVGAEGRGDHYIKFVIDIPKKLTAKQQLLYVRHLLRLYRFKLGSLRPSRSVAGRSG